MLPLHLAGIAGQVAPGAHAVLVLDGAGYHIAGDLDVPENSTSLKLPPYLPERNPIENVRQYLRQNKLALSVFENQTHIIDACCNAWNFFIKDPDVVRSVTLRSWETVTI
jgi:transposase